MVSALEVDGNVKKKQADKYTFQKGKMEDLI